MFRDTSVPFEDNDCATATYTALNDNYIRVANIEYDIANAQFPGDGEESDARA